MEEGTPKDSFKKTRRRKRSYTERSSFCWRLNENFLVKMITNIKASEEGVKNYWFQTTLFMDGHLAREAFIGDESIGL